MTALTLASTVTPATDLPHDTAIAPDRVVRVPVEGGRVVAYVYGEQYAETILGINGGPGVESLYLRKALSVLAGRGYRVVVHDQLGTGASDNPDDPALWTLRRYVAEVETVRRSLGLGRVHLLGHSWGGWLGTEYALAHPDAVRSYILSNTTADIPSHLGELGRLLAAFGAETLAMVERREREGTTGHPEYKAICTLFYARHLCRLEGSAAEQAARPLNMQIQMALWGPAEFSVTGQLKDWNRLPDLHRLTMPCLILVGAHDFLTPRSAALMRGRIPDSEMIVFPDSSHSPHLEEPEAYLGAITRFLEGVRNRG